MKLRTMLGMLGVLLMLYGAARMLTEVPPSHLVVLTAWLVAAVAIHDGVLSPLVVAIGAALRAVPPRGRRYLQAGLLVGALVTVVAAPLILREGSQPASKALLIQPYGAHLTLLLILIAVGSCVIYATRVVRDRTPER